MANSVRPHRRQPTRLRRPWDSPGKNTGVGCRVLLQCMKVKSESELAQPHPTLCDPTDCSLPGSSIHGIFQARVLEWGAIAFSGIESSSALISNEVNTLTEKGKLQISISHEVRCRILNKILTNQIHIYKYIQVQIYLYRSHKSSQIYSKDCKTGSTYEN